MASYYLIQIVNKKSGEVVKSWLPGERVEKEIETELLSRVKAKGVGFFKSEEKGLTAVREALQEFLYSLKELV